MAGLSTVQIAIICICTMNGPGLVTLPGAFHQGGVVATLVLLAMIAWATVFTCDRVVMVLAWAKRQQKRSKRTPQQQSIAGTYAGLRLRLRRRQDTDDPTAGGALEFPSLAALVAGGASPAPERITAALLALCLQSLALAQMVLCAQAADALLVWAGGASAAVGYGPSNFARVAWSSSLALRPFAGAGPGSATLLSGGFVLAACAAVLLGRLDLSEAFAVHAASLALLCGAVLRFLAAFLSDMRHAGFPSEGVVVGPAPIASLGSIVFNFAFVVAIPSLVADKRPNADVGRAASRATTFMAFVYAVVGSLGFFAGASGDNFVASRLQRADGAAAAADVLAFFAWAFSQLLAIPVYCELAKRLLLAQGWTPRGAYLGGTVAPWALAALLYQRDAFGAIVDAAALFVLGFANYTVPLVLDVQRRLLEQHRPKTLAGMWALVRSDRGAAASAAVCAGLTALAVVAISHWGGVDAIQTAGNVLFCLSVTVAFSIMW